MDQIKVYGDYYVKKNTVIQFSYYGCTNILMKNAGYLAISTIRCIKYNC